MNRGSASAGDALPAKRFTRALLMWVIRRDRNLMRLTGFSAVVWFAFRRDGRPYQHSLLLTTKGARTGTQRTVTLPYWTVDDSIVVCGSNAGGPSDPHWVGNIRADPRCLVVMGRRRIAANARISTGGERRELFGRIEPVHPHLAAYRERAARLGRELPLVVLTLD